MELSEVARQKRNAYQREYRRKNRDKIRKYNQNYWEKQAGNVLPDQVKKLSARGMSQREIAAELGISVGSVNQYLNVQ
jgi:DNA-binding NarL/FixJ family response regulator